MSDATLIQLDLGGGLDETNEDTDVPADKMRVCQNVVWQDAKNAFKRPGLKAVGGVNLANIQRIFARDAEVIAVDGQQATAYVRAGNTFTQRGPVSPCTVRRSLLASGNTADLTSPFVPAGSQAEDATTKLRVYAWSDGQSIQSSVLDVISGAYVVTETELNQQPITFFSIQPRVVICNGYAYILYSVAAGPGLIYYRSINLSAPLSGFAAEAPILFGGSGVNSNLYEAFQTYASGTLAPIVAFCSAIFSNMVIGTLQAIGGVLSDIGHTIVNFPANSFVDAFSAASTGPNEANPQIFAIACVGNSFAGPPTTYNLSRVVLTPLAAGNPTVLYPLTVIYNYSDTPANATQGQTDISGLGVSRTIIGNVAGGAATQWIVSWTSLYRVVSRQGGVAIAAADHRFHSALYYWTVNSANTLGAAVKGPFIGFQTQSKPVTFTWNGVTRCFVLAQYQDGVRWGFNVSQNTLVAGTTGLCLLRLETQNIDATAWQPPQPCAVAAPRFAGNAFAGNSEVALAWDGSGFTCIGTEQDAAGATSLDALQCNFNDPALWQTVRLGDWVWISGGLPMQYDGSTLHEVGFINAPPMPVIGFPAAGGGVLPPISTLTYILVYTQQDALGNIHRSPPSAPLIVNATAGYASAQLGIVPYSITMRQTAGLSAGVIGSHPVRIEIYRNNSGAGLTVFQLVASIPNDPSAATILYTDTRPDAAGISTEPLLYTTGGAVPSDGPPNMVSLAVHADRIFGIAEDGQTAYFTTPLTRAEAPRFTDAFTVTWPEGPVTCQWSLEQRLHAATADRIFYVFGDGPNDNGAGSNITLPSVWQESFGVLDPRGFALIPDGALLYTKRGLYLESRDGTFHWLPQCRRSLAANPIVTSISVLTSDGAVRICAQQADGASQLGIALHWDYRHDRWSQHLMSGSVGFLSSCVAAGVYYAMTSPNASNSYLWQEQTQQTKWYDTPLAPGFPTFVPIVLTTGWADVAGKQGSARVHRVMAMNQPFSPHGLEIETARDYSVIFDADAGVWSDSDITAIDGAGSTVEQLRHTPTQQKCMAMSVRVTETAPTVGAFGTGRGLSLRQLLLRSRSRRGEWKRQATIQQR